MRKSHSGRAALLQFLRAELRRKALSEEPCEPTGCGSVLSVWQPGILYTAAKGFRLVANP
jgi:hypothetical protein